MPGPDVPSLGRPSDEDTPLQAAAQTRPQREPRREITLPAFANLAQGSRVSLTIVDLSVDGCKVETPIVLEPGSRLTLSVMKLGLLQATVRWYREGQAGLCFSSEPEETRELHPRTHDRVTLSAKVSLRRQGSGNYTVTTTDVSPSGCRVEFVERPKAGDIHWVKFNGLEALEVHVRWVEGFSAGVQFTRSIHPAVFDMLVARLHAEQPG